jgi:histidinol-phosphate aminotransferase
MRSIWELANPQLKNLKVYEPGKPIEETARELQMDPASIVKLASNENPLGPSPAAIEAMRTFVDKTQLYPDGSSFYLKQAIAERLNLVPENIILGNGSNEIIEFLGHAFLERGDNIITAEYAFIAYKIIATLFDVETVEVPSPDFRHHLPAMLDAVTPRTRLIFVANPNNPTGTLVDQAEIDDFMQRLSNDIIPVFDEAYYEFLDDPPDTVRYVRQNRNVVVLRTFSKIHGLAGVRVGYGIAPAPLIEVLQKTREPFNLNSIGQVGALAALADDAHQRRTKATVDSGRTYVADELHDMGVQFILGAGNFVMANVGDGSRIFREMLARKVIVRPLVGYGLTEWVRISIGTKEQNQQCIFALQEILTRGT